MRILCLLASLFYFLGAVSQDHTQKSFTVKYITETIVPDGILDLSLIHI